MPREGRPGRDEEIEKVIQSIRAAGKAGLPVIEYLFQGNSQSPDACRMRVIDEHHARIRICPNYHLESCFDSFVVGHDDAALWPEE